DALPVGGPGVRGAPPADVEDPPLLVADEERRLGRRVVVVEELEDEPEAALRAPLRAPGKARRPLAAQLPVPAIRADEEGHAERVVNPVAVLRQARRGRREGSAYSEEARRSIGDRKAKVLEAALGHHPAPGGALDQALLEQVRLIDVLDRVLLLVDRG